MSYRRTARVLAILVMAATANCSSCINMTPTTDAITTSFNNAIAELGANSTQWQQTLSGLEHDLVQQGQQTLANQVQSVIDRGIAAAAVEAKCGVDFLKARLSEEIQGILAGFQGHQPPPPKPHFCSVDPSAIDLRLSPNQRPSTLNVYGFNLTVQNVEVSVVHANGNHTNPQPGFFNVPTEYLATFNLVDYPFKDNDTQLKFKLADGEVKTVGINQAAACGGPGQKCCANGRACDPGSGCRDDKCVTCPAPYVPVTKTLLHRSDEFDGNNCGGVNNVHHYGGACDSGMHRQQCQTTVVNASSDTSCKVKGWSSNDANDCSCDVLFHSPADCFKGIHCAVTITQTSNEPARPAGCP